MAQRMSEPLEFGFVPLKCAARYLEVKPNAAIRFRRQGHVDKTSLQRQRSRWPPSLENKHDGVGGADCKSHSEIWIHASELDSAERWRSGVLCSDERRPSWTLKIYVHGSGNSNESCNPNRQIYGEFFDVSIESKTQNETH